MQHDLDTQNQIQDPMTAQSKQFQEIQRAKHNVADREDTASP